MSVEVAAPLIAEECDAIKALLLEKNAQYGNSALDPVRIFSKGSPVEQILVRIDDKLSRLARGADAGEDVVLDLVGYLVLLRVARRLEQLRPATVPCRAEHVAGVGSRCMRPLGHEGQHDFAALLTLAEHP